MIDSIYMAADILLGDLKKRVLEPNFNLPALERAFIDVPQNKRIPYMIEILELAALENPKAFKIMFADVLNSRTSMDIKALLVPLLKPYDLADKELIKIKNQAEGFLMDLIASGNKARVLPLLEKNPALLTKEFTEKMLTAAYTSELANKVPQEYTKSLALQIRDIKTQEVNPASQAQSDQKSFVETARGK